MNKKSTGLLLSILGVLSLVLITAGVTYAFFNYMKEGVTENVISTGTITFYYDELDANGSAIDIQNALPMTDDEGKALGAENEHFDFTITSEITGDTTIEYEITARKDETVSTLSENSVKIWLDTTADGTNNTVGADGKVALYGGLTQTDVTDAYTEKTLFTGVVPAKSTGQTKYSEDFTLKMWIDGESATGTATDYSPYEFVLKDAVTATGALKADALINAEGGAQLITSTDYYAKDAAGRALYERIAYVNTKTREIYTVSQVTAANGFTFEEDDEGNPTTTVATAPTDFVAGEQFYALNGQSFKVTVNVYANTPVVAANNPDQGA